MFHGNALFQTVLGSMLVGARGALEPGFSLTRFWDRVREAGATQLSVLGAMIQLLWEQPPQPDDADNPARCAIGAPMAAEVHRAWEERFGLRFLTGFGLTEANPILISSMGQPPVPGSAGRRHEQFEVQLVDEDDRPVPVGSVGEIVCRPRGPHAMFDGYLDDPAATVAATRGLWFRTGDCAREDHDGWFTFVDRKRDRIRRRGENISSWELECTVASHPGVEAVAAYGVPSELSEDEVMVAVVRKPGHALEPEELVAHCANRMPYFAVPRFVRFVDDLPYNDLGKVQKDLLRAEGSAGAWDRERSDVIVER
jgi:crotonobetaine/carnitine-CoA ligase